jgi:hypothetical protein
MMLAALALFASPITFEAPAAPLARVLEQLEEATGIAWRARPEMEGRVVFVSVSEVAPADLQQRLAEAAGGRWRDRDGVPTLERDPEADRTRREAILTGRRDGIERLFAEYRKVLERPFDAAEALDLRAQLDLLDEAARAPGQVPSYWHERRALYMRGPATRAMLRFLFGLPVDELAALPPWSRTVFAADPTRMQRPLGRGAGRVVDEYVREQGVWAAAFAARPWRRDYQIVSDPRNETGALSGRPGLYLVVRRGEESSLFNVDLMQDGASGPDILAQLSVRPDVIELEAEPEALERIPTAEIAWSPAAQALLAHAAQDMLGQNPEGPPGVAPLGSAARPFVLDPVTHEPADTVIGDALRTWARAGYDVVAALPDVAIVAVLWRPGGTETPTVRGFLGPWLAYDVLDLRTDAGWAIVTPGRNDRVVVSNLNRAAPRDFTASVDRHGATFDALASYFWRSRDHGFELGLGLASLLDRTVHSLMDGNDQDGLRLYGSLTRSQRTTLETGGAIHLGALTAAQREIARRIAYGSVIRPVAPGPGGSWGPTIEPTSAFPNGLPATGYLSLTTRREETLTMYRRQADGNWRALQLTDPRTIGWVLATQPAGAGPGGAGELALYAYRVTGRETLDLRVHFDDQHWNSTRLTRLLPAGDRPVPWTELPEPIRARIEAARREFEAQPGRRTGTTPPSPP